MKKLLVPILHRLAFATGVSRRRAQALTVGRIITFHGVGAADCSTRGFEAQLRLLASNYAIVSLATLLERMATARGLTNEVVLTFDDGLRNNLTTAYPLLKKYGAPATFFICPGLVAAGRWLWTHETRARLAHLPAAQRGGLAGGNPGVSDEAIVERMKQMGLAERRAAEEQLRRETTGFSPTPAQRQRYDLMDWDELRQLDPALITLGSHSLTHPILSTLTGAELAVELVESWRLLENKLQRPVEFFCYPNGAHNPEVARLAQENYRATCSTEPGFVTPASDRQRLPRIGSAPGAAYLAWRLHRPGA